MPIHSKLLARQVLEAIGSAAALHPPNFCFFNSRMTLAVEGALKRLRRASDTLSFGNGDIDVEGCKALAEGLKHKRALTNIEFKDCGFFGDQVWKALAEGLTHTQTRKGIQFKNCYFELGTWGALASSLRRKSALTSIAFEGAKRCLLGDATLLLNGSSLALVCKTSSAMYR